MHKGRFEAFTDAVIAIVMTVMVLDLKTPDAADLGALWRQDGPELAMYVLSFTFLGIYWSNHHHMMQVAKHVNGAVLWANLHLLFWLSLIPFGTNWMGRTEPNAVWPTVLYGVDLFLCAIAYTILNQTLLAANRDEPAFAEALGNNLKGRISLVLYAVGVGLAFVSPVMARIMYVAVALIWIVPDRRFEKRLASGE